MLAPLMIAHAACKGHAPENTLAGIRAALAMGVDAIEIDVHATRDGVPVLMHDATVDRTTDGSGAVHEMTLAEIRALDAGGDAFDGRFRGEPVPTLADVLELTRRTCLLVVEIKASEIEREVAEVVRRLDAAGSAMVWSFRSEVVAAWRELMPEVPAAQLTGEAIRDLRALLNDTVRRNAQAISISGAAISPELVHAARLRGLTVYTWTVDEPEEQARVAAAGVDGIVTNVPDVLRATLQRTGIRRAGALAQPTV
jgi:glycerophosphoryl diester phosphodiesterase